MDMQQPEPEADMTVRAASLAFLHREPDPAEWRAARAQLVQGRSVLAAVAQLVHRQVPADTPPKQPVAKRLVPPDFEAVGRYFRADWRSDAGRRARRLAGMVLHPLVRIALAERDRIDRQAAALAGALADELVQSRAARAALTQDVSVLTDWVARLSCEVNSMRSLLDQAEVTHMVREQSYLRETLSMDQAAIAARLLSIEDRLQEKEAMLF